MRFYIMESIFVSGVMWCTQVSLLWWFNPVMQIGWFILD